MMKYGVALTLVVVCLCVQRSYQLTEPTGGQPEDNADNNVDNSTVAAPSTITCFSCKSEEDDNCHDFKDLDKVEKKPCKAGETACLKVITLGKTTGTLKTSSTVAKFTTRSCATNNRGYDSCIYLDGSNTDIEKCYCSHDLCNTGHVIVTSVITWFCCGSVMLVAKRFLL